MLSSLPTKHFLGYRLSRDFRPGGDEKQVGFQYFQCPPLSPQQKKQRLRRPRAVKGAMCKTQLGCMSSAGPSCRCPKLRCLKAQGTVRKRSLSGPERSRRIDCRWFLVSAFLRNGQSTVSGALFRKRKLTELCRKLGESCESGVLALAHK